MTTELDVWRIAGRAAFLAKLVFLPAHAHVRIGAVLEQLLREFERRHSAARQRRSMSGVADAGGAVRSRLSQPRNRMERRAPRIRRVRIRAVVEQERRE